MTTFRPLRPPRGRLARIGIVLDTRNAPGRVREIAAMCDGADIDALWVRDHLSAPDREPRVEAWTALALAATAVTRARLGATLTPAFRPVGVLAAMAGTLDAASGGRLELGLSTGWSHDEHDRFGLDLLEGDAAAVFVESYARDLRSLLAGETVALGTDGVAELGVASPQPNGPRISIEAASPRQMEVAASVADDVVLRAGTLTSLDEVVTAIRDACIRVDRDPASLGIAFEVPVSIGRTRAEAEARAAGETLFDVVGHPARVGVFGTLEECQERVIAFAHAGVTDLRCILPNNPDIHDVIAQLTAIAIGSVDVLSPGAPRSRHPDPPESWGGRQPRPAIG
jgi:alkanesulfonate monooxygenase SsuD/methylene tetrahydromethanopterin reductase-like flavin-dependent oxidoreductase (luciferase family)